MAKKKSTKQAHKNQKYPQYCWEFYDRLWEALSGTTSEKRGVPSRTGGGDNSGNALEASNALNYRVWGIPAVLSTGIPGNALRAFPGSFRNFSGISSGKSQPYWGWGPKKGFLLTMTRQSYGASGVEIHVGRAHGWSVFTRFQTHIGGTQARKPQRVLGFDPLPFLGSRI